MVKSPQDTAKNMSKQLVCLGAIAGAHGVRGEMRVKTFTQNSLDIAAYGALTNEDETQRFVIIKAAPDKLGARVQIEGIKHRDQATALKGTRLYVNRSALPTLAEEDDFYHADLVGLKALSPEGEGFGEVLGVHNFGAGDLLEVNTGTTTEFIPFTKENVPQIDVKAGQLTIITPIMADMNDIDTAEEPDK